MSGKLWREAGPITRCFQTLLFTQRFFFRGRSRIVLIQSSGHVVQLVSPFYWKLTFVPLLADEQMVRSKYCQMSYKVGNRWQKGWDNSNLQSRPLLVDNTISNLKQLWLISIRHCLSSTARATPLPDMTQHERWKGEARSITGTSLLVVLLCDYYYYWSYYGALW